MTFYACRVPGCTWTGEELDAHLIAAHGWTYAELLDLAAAAAWTAEEWSA